MTSTTLAFSNIGTITRTAGSFVTDGWVARQKFVIGGGGSNAALNPSIRTVTASVITVCANVTLVNQVAIASTLTIDNEGLLASPPTGSTATETVVVNSSDPNGIPLDNYCTLAAGLGVTKISAGTWNCFLNLSSSGGTCTAKVEICRQDITSLVTSVIATSSITDTLTTTPKVYEVFATIPSDIAIPATEKVVVRVLALNSGADKTVTWTYQGTAMAPYIDTTIATSLGAFVPVNDVDGSGVLQTVHGVAPELAVRWMSLSGFTTTAASAFTITWPNDTSVICPGTQVRVLDKAGVVTSGSGYLANFKNITGIVSSMLNQQGGLLFVVAADGSVVISKALGAGVIQIGHVVAGVGVANNKPVVADNGSGLGGTLDVVQVGGPTNVLVEFYKWYTVTAVTTTLLTLAGPSMSTGASMIPEVFYASNRGALLTFLVSGSFAGAASTTLLASFLGMFGGSKWLGQPARITKFKVGCNVVGTVPPMINVLNNAVAVAAGAVTTSVSAQWYTSASVQPAYARLVNDSNIEVSTTLGDTGSTDLSVGIALVIE